MPKFQITGPDGNKYEVTAPEGATDDQVLSFVQQSAADKPLSVKTGEAIREIPRQLGLTARYGLEGAAALPAMIADIPGRMYNLAATGIDAAAGTTLPRAPLAANAMPAALDLAGFPQPRTPDERVVGDVTRTMAGAGTSAKLADAAAQGLTGAARAVAQGMAVNPGQQIAAGAGAGAAGGSVREAGGGPVEQMIASLFGGIGAGIALPAAGNRMIAAADAVKSKLAPQPAPQSVDLQISLALQQHGINYAALSDDVRSALRSEVTQALNTGGSLRPETLSRLADFRTVGATPTRGTVTLDPVQLTREKNLAKVGANSTDVNLQRLPQIENSNNAALVESINRLGAANAPSRVAAGETLVGAADDWLSAQKAQVDALYGRARDSQGRSMPLDAPFLANRAANLLEDNLVSAALPADVRSVLNRVARGEMPLTVDIAEQLKTRIGVLQRASNDGTTRTALGLVRQAIDETPVLPLGQQSGPVGAARPVNPGGMPSAQGSTQAGDDAIAAFNQARAANRQMMQTIESIPALRAVRDGIEPDKFVQQFIVGDGRDASVNAVRSFTDLIRTNPDALAVARQQVAAYLKQAAVGNAPDDVANFSAAGFRNALDRIGPEKLSVFFSPEEIARLQATSRVANYTLVQPRGTAVNNSNTGAMNVAAGLDFLDRLAARVPLAGSTIQGVVRGVQQSGALNTTPALVSPRQPQGLLTVSELARTTPTPTALGLLLSTPASERERKYGLLSAP